MALDMLASGSRRVEAAILEKGSWGEGGMNTAAAIHKDTAGYILIIAGWRLELVEDGGWQGGGVLRS